MEEIDLPFTPDDPMPPGIKDDDDSERDIPILEELLDNYSLSLPANESYHFDIPLPYRPSAKPPYGNTGTLNIKMMGDVSEVPIPNLMITLVLNQEKSPDLLSHQGFEAFQPSAECPMIIHGKNIPLLDIDSLFDEFAGELTILKSISSRIDETDCHPEEEIQLLDNYSLSLPANESYHFDIPSPYRPSAKPPDGNTRTLNIKMMVDVSE
nr:hypothetical protein [Tanacetum cinerariifolium]